MKSTLLRASISPRLFRASISTLFTGEHRIISIKPKPAFCNFNGHSCRSIYNPRTLADCQFYSSSVEDDDFSESGSLVSLGAGTVLKLMTEKPEPLMKIDPARKASSGMSLPAESSPTSKDIPLKQGKPLPAPHLKVENDNEVSRLIVNSNSGSNCQNSRSITIESIPSVISLSQLKEAISVFGKISNASMRTVPNELDCCNVEFESVESSSRAVSVGWITVKGFHLPIRPPLVRETVTIRISNISKETTDSELHSVCMSYGPLDGLVRTKDDAVDVLFSVKDNSETQIILKRLNCSIIDDCGWLAHVLPRDATSEVTISNNDAQCKLRLQINTRLADLKRDFYMKKVYAEDLEDLHFALVHLEGHPATISKQSNVD